MALAARRAPIKRQCGSCVEIWTPQARIFRRDWKNSGVSSIRRHQDSVFALCRERGLTSRTPAADNRRHPANGLLASRSGERGRPSRRLRSLSSPPKHYRRGVLPSCPAPGEMAQRLDRQEPLFRARASGPFVLEARAVIAGEPSREPGTRCISTFRRVNCWLRAHGITGHKALHTLRKEAGSLVATRDGIFRRIIIPSSPRHCGHGGPLRR